MAIATITSKGQVTLPKRVREQLHLKTGDKLDFCIEEDGTLRIYPIAKSASEVFGAFRHKATKACATEEIDEKLKQAFKQGKL